MSDGTNRTGYQGVGPGGGHLIAPARFRSGSRKSRSVPGGQTVTLLGTQPLEINSHSSVPWEVVVSIRCLPSFSRALCPPRYPRCLETRAPPLVATFQPPDVRRRSPQAVRSCPGGFGMQKGGVWVQKGHLTQNAANSAAQISAALGERSKGLSMAAEGDTLVSVDYEIFGKVQGVFFRKYTQAEGKKLGLVGWVQNTDRGTVKGQLQGPISKVRPMQEWLQRRGSPKSHIDRANFNNEKVISKLDYADFQIVK
ncbi:acylphosphatase 1 erythrocyte (common) type [Cricetulus griseus]